LALTQTPLSNFQNSIHNKSRPLILGHRGSSAIAPENTMIAFKQSFADGANGIEFDVRLAKDGVPVVIHDSTLKRTAGIEKKVCELTSKELSKIDVGSWFNKKFPQKANEDFSNAAVPTLNEVLKAFKNINPPVCTGGTDIPFQLYVEMKFDEGEDFKPLVEAVVKEIRKHRISKQIVVESFELASIKELKNIAPKILTAALFEPTFLRYVGTKQNLIEEALAHNADFFAPHYTLATAPTVRDANKHGLKTVIWTADNPVWLGRSIQRGIHAIITNNPGNLKGMKG
jgi:glycerophosphoryl diester phosphodiesterase